MPALMFEITCLSPILCLLGEPAMPVVPVTLNSQTRRGNGKINNERADRILLLCDNAINSEGIGQLFLNAADAWPRSSGKLRGASPRTGAETVPERIAHHLWPAADFTSHLFPAALKVVPFLACQCSCIGNTAFDGAACLTRLKAAPDKEGFSADPAGTFDAIKRWVIFAPAGIRTIRAGLRAVFIGVAGLLDLERFPAVLASGS